MCCLISRSQALGLAPWDDAPQESQAFADVISISPNIFLVDPCVQGEEAFHASGFGENIASVAELRGLDHNSRLQIEDVFTAEQVKAMGTT